MNSPGEKQCLELLRERGWGDGGNDLDAEEMLKTEEKKTWEVIREAAPDLNVFDAFSDTKLYHNLKAAIKEVCTEVRNENIFYDDCEISGEEMLRIVENKEFSRLPGKMPEAAQDAYDTLLHTRDGQLCDVIIHKAALEAIYGWDRIRKMRSSGIMRNLRLRSRTSRSRFVPRRPEIDGVHAARDGRMRKYQYRTADESGIVRHGCDR